MSDPTNGRVILTTMTTTFNSEARYTCNSGYIRIGNEIRFCGTNGEWTGNPPTCVGKETVLGFYLHSPLQV